MIIQGTSIVRTFLRFAQLKLRVGGGLKKNTLLHSMEVAKFMQKQFNQIIIVTLTLPTKIEEQKTLQNST